MPGVGLGPEQLDQAVVAPSSAKGRLLTQGAALIELERSARVVIEATNQERCRRDRHAERIEVLEKPVPMRSARVTQVVGDPRCPSQALKRPGIL